MELEKWYKVSKEEEFKKNPQLDQNDIDTIREWMAKQQYFPEIPDHQIILFLRANHFSVERTKENIENYFTMRTIYTNFFSERIYSSEAMKTAREVIHTAFLEGTDDDGNRVFWCSLRDPNPALYNPVHCSRYLTMIFDADQLEKGSVKGYSVVMDSTGFVFGHGIKWNLGLVKQNVAYNQDGSNLPILRVYFINTNSVVENLVNMAKKIMSPELAKKVYVISTKNYSKIFDTIPKKIVPSDCGGDCGKTKEELSQETHKVVNKYADYFVLEEKLRVNDLKRAQKSKFANDVEGIQGSFKKLDLD
ncbi:unnamed protein product [Bemisia tabaci]|uniref:CRAL-TRIO domain-containing protein n=1 Tax=Bemisia tabaci TaxID=7038 RepID=A0A9P0AE36_BEMTA|nr:unnamed protein product [Bemisia tabaci]